MDKNYNDSQSYAANCGLFWVANSVVSTIMGTTNRSLHEEAAQRNLDFQRELEDARNIAQDEVEAEKIAFKRRVMKLSRQYRQAESAEMFEQMTEEIRENTVRLILAGKPQIDDTERKQVAKATGYGAHNAQPQKKSAPVVNPYKDLKRNDKCHCGSGKKYKDCCLMKDKAK